MILTVRLHKYNDIRWLSNSSHTFYVESKNSVTNVEVIRDIRVPMRSPLYWRIVEVTRAEKFLISYQCGHNFP